MTDEKVETPSLIQLLTDPENQPHQFVGDPVGLRALLAAAEPLAARPPSGEQAVRDAERYRWLRSEDAATNPKFYPFWTEFNTKLCREEKMDSAIDAAMKDAALSEAVPLSKERTDEIMNDLGFPSIRTNEKQ
jgi:hypothetical protein